MRTAAALAAAAVLSSASHAAAPAESLIPVREVTAGRTRLLDDPAARVGYRLDGSAEEVWLGDYWSGFDPASGVWFEPEDAAGAEGRRALFMHCPWTSGTGAAFAEFALSLPDVEPLRLEVGTMLRPSAPATDGVTFRVRVDGQILFSEHCTWKAPQASSVDLAPFRGKRVAVRLEVDPGPARNPRDDWSLWTQADIVGGTPEQIAAAERGQARRRQEALDRELAAAQARAARSLLALSSREARALTPSTLERVVTESQVAADRWVFTARDSTDEVRYELSPVPTAAGEFPVAAALNGTPLRPAPFVLRLRALTAPGESTTPWRVVRIEPAGEGAGCRMALRCGDAGPERELFLRAAISGKTLRLGFEAPAGHFAGIALARRGGRAVPAVYALAPTVRYDAADAYGSGTADLWESNAAQAGPNGTSYQPLTDGSRRPLRDAFVLTVSSRYEETLLNPPHAPSPFLGELAGRVLLDVWDGPFDQDAEWLRAMAAYGLDRLVIIKHVWQRDGYDRSYPNVFPANAAQGGDEALRRLAAAAAALGHRFCLHENFYDYYPNAEDFRAEDCALRGDGSRVPGWDRGPVKAATLKPSRLLDYARRFSPQIRERYGCTAAYHDIMPTWHVDFDAAVPDSGIIRVTHEITRRLCAFDRELFGGPVLFEAADPALAGVYDGGTASGEAIEDYPLLPVHELLKIHPKMSNHGMSYYERWLSWGYGPGWYRYVMTDRELDKYRAMTIAFGRTGFIGHQLMPHPHGVVREYWLMRAFARAYTDRQVVTLAYNPPGTDLWVDAATAARHDLARRLRVEYEGGQAVAVNAGAEPWPAEGVTLPPYGAVTRGPRATAWTALLDDQIADYAEVDGTVYADARSHVWQPDPSPPPIRAEAAEFADLGGGRFRIAVRWLPERTPERDTTVFWHFVDTGIAFQSDHQPPLPASRWRPGEAVLDGPRELTVPAAAVSDAFTFAVGLYDRQGRLPLAGSEDTLTLGRLRVSRKDGAVAALRFEPPAPGEQNRNDPERYRAGANLARRVLRFPALATDGAVVLRRGPGGIDLTPVPLTETVTVGLPGRFARICPLAADGFPDAPLPAEEREGMTWFRIGGDRGRARWRAVPLQAP